MTIKILAFVAFVSTAFQLISIVARFTAEELNSMRQDVSGAILDLIALISNRISHTAFLVLVCLAVYKWLLPLI